MFASWRQAGRSGWLGGYCGHAKWFHAEVKVACDLLRSVAVGRNLRVLIENILFLIPVNPVAQAKERHLIRITGDFKRRENRSHRTLCPARTPPDRQSTRGFRPVCGYWFQSKGTGPAGKSKGSRQGEFTTKQSRIWDATLVTSKVFACFSIVEQKSLWCAKNSSTNSNPRINLLLSSRNSSYQEHRLWWN